MSNFEFTRRGRLIVAPSGMPTAGPYYTTLVAMKDVENFPFDYALYFSTDHENGPGGVWLYVCDGLPTDARNWKSYDEAVVDGDFDHVTNIPAANPIYQDPVQGTGHTETPHANVIDGTVYMTYHKNGIEDTQRTLLATSDDGVNFSRINGDDDSVVLRYDANEDVGDGHTGYFRWAVNPFSGIAQKFVGYSLHGGGDDYHSAIWVSDDAMEWDKLDVFTPTEGFTVEKDRMIIWHELDPASITQLDNGEYVAICGVGNRASGSVERISELYEIYLGDDGRTLKRESCKLLGRDRSEAGDAEELASPTTMVIDDEYHLVYIGASRKGSVNIIMGAIGSLDKSQPQSVALDAAEQTRHLYRD
ncbi:MAG: hypothetical protein QGG64_05525 [Candidatus Latescibacteria bacterium]|jgi:hypothetical protein|nr:hypothetical protein [Candidatus Latescibacterota bacterium]